MKKIFAVTIVLAVFMAASATGIELDVPFKAQVPPGTADFSLTKNCGPTSVLMTSAYHYGFIPATEHIQNLNDWMVKAGIITSVNNYNGQDTNADDLVRIAKEYYGFQTAAKYNEPDLNLLRQSLSSGNPVIIGVQINMGTTTGGHFMVLVGMTDTDVIVNDPGRSLESGCGDAYYYSITQFQDSWATQTYCSVVIDGDSGGDILAGREVDGTVDWLILGHYNLHGGLSSIGWPIDDGGGIYVHEWAPFRYVCQNFRNPEGEESIIMYDPLFGSQAYRISGKFWEYYRHGRNDRYGPDIPLDNGKTLGCPISNWGTIQCFEQGYCKSGSVELHQLDGTLVDIYEPTGEFSSLTITGKAQSQNHNTVTWLGGPVCDYYSVFANGSEVGQTTLSEFTEAGLSPGVVRTYYVRAMSTSGEVLATSNEVTVVSPGQPGEITLTGAPEGYSSLYLEWDDTLYLTPYHWIYIDGVLVAKSAGNAFSLFPLEPNTTYRCQVVAMTASNLVLGYSNEVWVTTDPAPPEPPTPDPLATSVQIQLEQTWLYATDGWG